MCVCLLYTYMYFIPSPFFACLLYFILCVFIFTLCPSFVVLHTVHVHVLVHTCTCTFCLPFCHCVTVQVYVHEYTTF